MKKPTDYLRRRFRKPPPCESCLHCIPEKPGWRAECRADGARMACENAREKLGFCGPRGKLWEAKYDPIIVRATGYRAWRGSRASR